MVSRSYINFKQMDCYYNKCVGCDETLSNYPSSSYPDDLNGRYYEDYYDIKEEVIQSDNDTLYTILEEIFNVYEFDPHHHVVEQHLFNSYYPISTPTNDTSSFTNDDNIPAIITDIVNDT